MNRTRRLTSLLLASALVLAIVAAGCASAKKPAPAGELPVSPGAGGPAPGRTIPVAVYFADWQAQHVIPEQHQVPEAWESDLPTTVIKELLAGPQDAHLNRPIPASVRLLENVRVQDGVAYVNFSQDFGNIQGAAGTAMAVQSVVLSLTDLPGINKVQILVEGKKDVMIGEGLLLEPMERGLYIYPVLPDPERARYLQERRDRGIETWRSDPAQVVQWEGRQFGFTAEELKKVKVAPQGMKAMASFIRDHKAFTMELAQQEGGKTSGVWTIVGITKEDAN